MPEELIKNNIERQDIDTKYRPIFFVILILPCFLVINKNLQNDIWFLLNSGRYIIEHGFPFSDPFSIHTGLEFVMQQWLSACIFWLTYNTFSYFGLHLLVLLCYALIVFGLFVICMKISGNYFFVSFCITMFASLMLSTLMTGRPTIFSTLILVFELYLMESYINNQNLRYLIPLPLLSVLLINLHAAIWPMLFIILAPYIVESFSIEIGSFKSQKYKRGPLLFFTVMMLLSGFANPYGIAAMTYLFKSYGSHELSMIVEEMRPPNLNTFSGGVIFSCFLIVVLIYAIYNNKEIKIRYALLTLGTAILSLIATRNFSFFAICGVFPLAYYLKDLSFPTHKQRENLKQTVRLRMVLISLIALSGIIALLVLPQSHFDKTDDIVKMEANLLSNTVGYILNEHKHSEVILYTGYNDGGMAEYMGIPAYIDPRAEVFLKTNNKKEDILKEYSDLQSGNLFYKDFLNKYNFTHLILTKYDILYTDLKYDKDYQITFSNEVYTLYEKKDQ